MDLLNQFPRITAMPYLEDTARLFSTWADEEWAVFLDSGHSDNRQGRYDIVAAKPFCTLITTGELTEIRSVSGIRVSPEDPFKLLRQTLSPLSQSFKEVPFSAGAIGYFGYDLARRVEKLPSIADSGESLPEMMVAIYDWMLVVDHQQQQSWLLAQGRDSRTAVLWDDLVESFSQYPEPKDVDEQTSFKLTSALASNMSQSDYAQAFAKIQSYILEGDCYQVNLAQRFEVGVAGDVWPLYQQLREQNSAPFSAYLNFPEVQILSSSPERFVQVRAGEIETKPIKGTRPRSNNAHEDELLKRELRESSKDQAENVMIVDLLRNDIGKTSAIGSVEVPQLFEVETFSTVHHLVSTVRGKLDDNRHALHLLRGCFPGGSITGAPKIRAMEIIEELEPARRDVYCGAIGWIGFDGNMDTNIAIRTLVCADGKMSFSAGGGIIADSELDAEYQETFDKAQALIKVLNVELEIENSSHDVGC